MLYLARTNSSLPGKKVDIIMQPENQGGTQVREFNVPEVQAGPVLISEIREWRCSGKEHHRVGVECLVRWRGQKYRMLREDGTPDGAFRVGVSTAFCTCGARWDYHSGGRIGSKNQLFE
jgi:hypothetical protein